MSRFDDTDEAIMAAFQADGRQSNREVARRLDISEGTVRQRLAKLQEARAIRFDVVTDPSRSGIDFVAFVRLSVAPREIEAVLDACTQLPALWYVASVTGRYNVMALISCATQRDAMQVINTRLRLLPGVNEVDVRVVIGSARHDFHEIVVRDEVDVAKDPQADV